VNREVPLAKVLGSIEEYEGRQDDPGDAACVEALLDATFDQYIQHNSMSFSVPLQNVFQSGANAEVFL